MKKLYNLQDKLKQLNRLHFFYNFQIFFLILSSSLFLSVFFSLFLSHILKIDDKLSLLLGFIFFLGLLSYQNYKKQKRKKVLLKDFALYLETENSPEDCSFLESYKKNRTLSKEEEEFLKHLFKNWKFQSSSELKPHKEKVFVSFMLCFLSFGLLSFHGKKYQPFSSFGKTMFFPSLHLKILKGSEENKGTTSYKLSPEKTEGISLTHGNLTKLTLLGFKNEAPTVVLFNEEGGTFQSFLFEEKKSEEFGTFHEAIFSLEQNLNLKIPNLYKEKTLASFFVKESKAPKIFMDFLSKQKDPFPSHEPIQLRIKAKSQKGLSQINLYIKAEGKTHSNLINDYSSKFIKKINLTETLYLDEYVSEDFSKVSLVVEAIDLSSPVRLKGFSNQISLNVISVYGQYKRALSLLKEIRHDLQNKKWKASKYLEKINKTLEISQQTPYFDHEDRYTLSKIKENLETLQKNDSLLEKTSEKLNDFLTEHEALDDRERDRDFFVAIRNLSSLFESEDKDKKFKLQKTSEKTIDFLKERFKRWEQRINELQGGEKTPSWKIIKKERPFLNDLKVIKKIASSKENLNKDKGKALLSKVSKKYEAWLNELESAENEKRKQKNSAKEKQLSSIRKTLKFLKKNQDMVSVALDGAEHKKEEELKDNWPITRTRQNSNLSELKKLGERLKSLNFEAGKRLESAKEAMKNTLAFGESSEFQASETNSDLAGRFLREAISKSKEKQGKKGRRRNRRNTKGDKYYGQAIHGGDIKIPNDYEIDKEYREDILKEIERAYENKDDKLLERYLKKIIR